MKNTDSIIFFFSFENQETDVTVEFDHKFVARVKGE
jgi:hypothetical protein